MTPEQINHAVTEIVGTAEIDTLQIVMLGPYLAEVKARRATDFQWFQGVVRIREEEKTNPPGHSSTYVDSEGEERCECGKWLEPGYYEMEDHLKSVLQDTETT